MRLMVRNYSRNRPVFKNGVLQRGVYIKRVPPDGCRPLDEPAWTVCASGPFELWVVFE